MTFSSNVTLPLASSADKVNGFPVADSNAATRLLMVLTLTVVLVRVSTMLTNVASLAVAVTTRGGLKDGSVLMLKEPSAAV